ncbi:MAG: BMP family ABC transporter substrate-binding protein [Bacillota bacterium]|nr:BMP family ABC transporter substrate-binding protein [Bacillota bacterium]
MFDVKAQEIYHDAKNKGKKEYNRLKSKGLSGHLSSLDGILKDIEIVGTSYLGTYEIPLKKVVGTYYHSRRMTFSKSFLPLESEHSEFGSKWAALCKAHLTEGIRDPIKVYEYMNYYYVVEGNKRVSVLKYYDAVNVMAEITRLIPKFDPEDDNIVLYYAFMGFFKVTKIINIWLSKPYRYKRLLAYLENYKPESQDENSKYEFFLKEVYMPFRRLYLDNGGEELTITTGDAFLLYARLYGISDVLDVDHVKTIMPNLIKECSRYGEQDEPEIVTTTDDMERVAFFDAISSFIAPRNIKVGFVYARTVEHSGWTYSHELGRQYIETIFGDRVTTGYIEEVPEDASAYEVIKDFASEGYDVVFTTSEVYRKATLKCAMEMPKVKFFNCSGNRPYVHMTNYFGRTYEPRFLTGLIAGALTKTGIVGYTATDPNPEVLSCINAFAQGMKMTNPNSKLLVTWTGEWNNPKVTTDLSQEMIRRGADLISNKNLLVPRDVTLKYGVYSMLCDIDPVTQKPKNYLASPIWRWGGFYEKIISSILNGSYQRMVSSDSESQRLINFWWGMESGVIDLYAAEDKLPSETMKLIKLMKKMIITDQYHPFTGPINDAEGNVQVEVDEILSAEAILNMDWYADNVEIISNL